jgi:hypothetical protein
VIVQLQSLMQCLRPLQLVHPALPVVKLIEQLIKEKDETG